MRCFLLVLLSVLAFAEDKPAALPASAQEEVAKSTKAIAKLKTEYLARANQEIERLQKALEEEMKKATRNGDLETALAVKAKREEMGNGLLVAIPVGTTPGDLSKPKLEQVIVGKWKRVINAQAQIFSFNADMTLKTPQPDMIKWSVENGKVVILWDASPNTARHGHEIIEYDEKTDMLKCDRGWTATRVKP